jgi:hypothetical protein
LIFALAAILATATAQAQSHAFTEINGQTYQAEVLSVKNGEVILRHDDGKVYRMDLSEFSPDDQKFLADWKAKKKDAEVVQATTDSDIVVKISVEDTKRCDATELSARVVLTNHEDSCSFKGLKGTLILVGQKSDDANKFKVLALEKFSGDVAARGKFNFNSPPFSSTDGTDPNQPSYSYQGYIFVLQNSDDNIIQFNHSDSFVNDGAAALKLRVGTIFTAPSPRISRRFRLVNYPGAGHALTGKKSAAIHGQPLPSGGF